MCKIRSVSEYLMSINEISRSIPGELETCFCQLVFRGQPNSKYEIMPSIGRGGGAYLPGKGIVEIEQRALTNEANYISAACHRLPSLFSESLNPVDLLARLQHYGIPTRLLDVTTNALAALYFACRGYQGSDKECDGEVIVFRCPSYDLTDYPVAQAIADSWRILRVSTDLSRFIDVAMKQPYFCYQRHAFRETIEAGRPLGVWLKQCCDKPQFVRGSADLDRQVSQAGLYILFPNRINVHPEGGESGGARMSFASRIDPIPKDHDIVVGDLIVDAGSKEPILRELQALGITEGSLFPDNVDAVCRDIRRTVGY